MAGLLYIPLSPGGRDFITFLRKGQPRIVKWAGRPYRQGEERTCLEPRTSFKAWSEIVAGCSRVWTDEQLQTVGVLSLVYGKVSLRFFFRGILDPKAPFYSSLRCGVKEKRRRTQRRSPTYSCRMLVTKVSAFFTFFGCWAECISVRTPLNHIIK